MSGYNVNVSEKDPRKPDVYKSYKARYSLAVAEIQGLFKNLVALLTGTPGENYKEWNGEEVAIMEAKKLAKGEPYRYLYTAGGDHHYVLAPFSNDAKKNIFSGLVGFDKIDDINRKYYAFYIGVGIVTKNAFTGIGLNSDEIWEGLIKEGLVDSNGAIQAKFSGLKNYSDMLLSGAADAQKEQIYDVLKQAQEGEIRIVTKNAFTGIGLNSDGTWEGLIKEGLIDSNGVIQARFRGLENYSDMLLSGADAQKQRIYDILKQAQAGEENGFNWQEYQRLVRLQVERGNRKLYDKSFALDEQQVKERLKAGEFKEKEMPAVLQTLDMEKREKVITAILDTNSKKDMETVLRKATILPRLDTDGKMVLARAALPNVDFVLPHTIRQDLNFGRYIVRDSLIEDGELKVFNVAPLVANVAATNTRNGLIAFLYGIINFNLLYGASKATLKKVFDPNNRDPLETLLRQEPLSLPLSTQNMLKDKNILQSDLAKLKDDIEKELQGKYTIELSDFTHCFNKNGVVVNKGLSIVTVAESGKTGISSRMNYMIVNTMNPKTGDLLNLLIYDLVEKQAFQDAKFTTDQISKLWIALNENEYIDANGAIQAKFKALKSYSEMVLPKEFAEQKEQIYGILQNVQNKLPIETRDVILKHIKKCDGDT